MHRVIATFDDAAVSVDADPDSPDWQRVLSLMPNPPVVCRACKGAATAVNGTKRVPHFRHLNADCHTAGESPEHLRIKDEIKASIDTVPGWIGDLEVAGSDGKWIADVLATSDTGKQLAFEVQLQPQDREWAMERHERRVNDGVDCIWVVGPKGRGSHAKDVPISVFTGTGSDGLQTNVTLRRLAEHDDLQFDQQSKDLKSLDWFVQSALNERIAFVVVDHYGEWKESVATYPDDARRYRQARKRYDADRRRDQAKRDWHQKNIEQLIRRQRSVLRAVLPELIRRHGAVQIGDKYDPFACKLDSDSDITDLPSVTGSDFWASAIPVSSVQTGRVVALICPVTSRIQSSRPGPSLYGVPVYCHTSDAGKIRSNYNGNRLNVINCQLEDIET